MGWNRAVEAARYFDTWVLCREAPAIAEYTERHGHIQGLHFVFVPQSRLERILERIPGVTYVAYKLWHRRAFRIARRLHEERPFSLVHQVTFSIWPDAETMAAFARRGPHAEAIRAVREEGWFNEELYARFRITGSVGTWQGRDPLAATKIQEAA